MSRSKKDILDTEAMLNRLSDLLYSHKAAATADAVSSIRADAESLRRISMTLRTWFEHECNGNIQRDETLNGMPWWYHGGALRFRVPDREAGARKRLAAILKRYPSLTAYVQGDPRGCALYLLKESDIPPGADIASCYSRGLAVHQ